MNTFRYISLFIIALLLGSCNTTDSTNEEASSFWEPLLVSGEPLPRASAPIEISLTLSDSQISADESFRMVLKIKNASEDSISVTMSGAGIDANYDFVILNSDSSIVWNRLNDAVPLAALIFDFAPGETKAFEHTWDLTDEQGDQVQEGEYAIFGGFTHLNYTNPETSEEHRGSVTTEMQQIVIE